METGDCSAGTLARADDYDFRLSAVGVKEKRWWIFGARSVVTGQAGWCLRHCWASWIFCRASRRVSFEIPSAAPVGTYDRLGRVHCVCTMDGRAK